MKCPMNNGERSFVEGAPNCPRCGCSNTKFCYYNNYSLTQPRFFCKGCRRYWTKGGSLRDVPVGGGCRKNRRRVSTTTKSLRMSNGSIGNHVTIKSSPSSPSMLHDDGSHIDMALVYANFLGQKNPDLSNTSIDINNSNINNNNGSQQVDGLLGVDDDHFDPCFIGSDDDFGLLLCPHYHYNNNDLPGQEQEEPLLWSSSQNLVVSQTAMQASREDPPLLLGPHEDEENLLLNGSWSSFDLMTSSDHTFLRRA